MRGDKKMKISIKKMALVSMFTALTAIGAGISIPLGEVPITMQSLFVILSGLLLGPKLGALSQLIYIILGLIGIPIFANFTGGLQAIMKPSFGFLIGFIFAAYAVGSIAHLQNEISNIRIWIASIFGTIIIYLFGLPYMYFLLNTVMLKSMSFKTIIEIGCIIFLPGDVLKLIVASLLAIRILPILKSHIAVISR